MKKVMVFLILAMLLTSAFAVAEEQSQVQLQTYSGLNRFVDNVRLLFSGGDNKVRLALEIREKEVNSAIENVKTDEAEKADKNLENAWDKLQLIQEKVSVNTAEEVRQNSEKIRDTIQTQENLPDDFNVYALEEEKTGLTAEWVIEKNGEQNQTMEREIAMNQSKEQDRVMEIETRIDEIDGEISNWVVEHTYAEGTTAGGEAGVVVEGGLTKVVKNEVATGDNGLKREVKTSVANEEKNTERIKEDSSGDTLNQPADYHESTGGSSGDCGEGVKCGGEDDVIEGGEGENHIDDASDSSDGGSSESSDEGSEGSSESSESSGGSSEGESSSGGGESSITGEAITETESEDNFLTRLFNKIFH